MVAAVAGSSGSIRSSILPPSKPIRAIAAASYPVNRSSISNTDPASPPRFIEPMTILPSSAPSSSRSSSTSAVPSTPPTPGRSRATQSRSSRSGPVGHGQPFPAGAQRPRGPGDRRPRSPAGRRGRPRTGRGGGPPPSSATWSGPVHPRLDDLWPGGQRTSLARASRASTSAAVGIASEQASLVATRAPAAFANRMTRGDLPSRPAGRGTAPRRTRPRRRSRSAPPPGSAAIPPGLPRSRPARRAVPASRWPGPRRGRGRACAARRGSAWPTATSTSSRLPTATVTWPSAGLTDRRAASRDGQNWGR